MYEVTKVKDETTPEGIRVIYANTCREVCSQQVDDAISRLEGIRCGSKQTSCPDQLARTLKLFL